MQSREDGTVTTPDEAGCQGIRSGYWRSLGFYSWLLTRHPGVLRTIVGPDLDRLRPDGAVCSQP